MGQTGLKNKTLLRLDANWEAYQGLQASKAQKRYSAILGQMLTFLKEIKASQDIHSLLTVEEMILHQEKALYANSPEEKNSVQKAIVQLQEGKNSLAIVKESEAYQKATATYSGKRKEGGLPLDSFREFLKSHSTRLTNRMASPLSVAEKNVLRQRKVNLSAVKDLYMGMQRKALGMPGIEKNQGKDLVR